jgi:hypothetical protein
VLIEYLKTALSYPAYVTYIRIDVYACMPAFSPHLCPLRHRTPENWGTYLNSTRIFFYLVCEATGTAATPGLLCQPPVIVKMIVEKHMECRLAGETEVLGENQPQRHFCPSQNSTWPDPGLNPGRRGGKTATNRLSYGAAYQDISTRSIK